MIKRLMILAFCLVLLGCNVSDNDVARSSENIELKQGAKPEIIELDANGDEAILELEEDKIKNILTIRTKKNDEVLSISGCGNNQFVRDNKGDIIIDTLNFYQSNIGYLITSFVNGSTYGAETYFLIHKKSQWLVSRLPFYRMRYSDINNDGIDELIDFKSQNDSSIYNFRSGIILPFDMNITTN